VGRLRRFFGEAGDWVDRTRRALLGAERPVRTWEEALLAGWTMVGYSDADGERLVERFLRERARELSPDEASAPACLRDHSWYSLFEVREVWLGQELRSRVAGPRGADRGPDGEPDSVMAFPERQRASPQAGARSGQADISRVGDLPLAKELHEPLRRTKKQPGEEGPLTRALAGQRHEWVLPGHVAGRQAKPVNGRIDRACQVGDDGALQNQMRAWLRGVGVSNESATQASRGPKAGDRETIEVIERLTKAKVMLRGTLLDLWRLQPEHGNGRAQIMARLVLGLRSRASTKFRLHLLPRVGCSSSP
jgi:hypothetical protein